MYDDPNPPEYDADIEQRVIRRSRRIRRRWLATRAGLPIVLLAGLALAIPSFMSGSNTHLVRTVAPSSHTADAVPPIGTNPPPTTTAANQPVMAAPPAPTSTSTNLRPAIRPATTAAPVAATTLPPTLRFENSSNGQHYTVVIGTQINVYLSPDPNAWSGMYINNGSTNVLRQRSEANSSDGSISAGYTAVGSGGVQIWATHPCSNPPGGPGTCATVPSYILYVTVTT